MINLNNLGKNIINKTRITKFYVKNAIIENLNTQCFNMKIKNVMKINLEIL